MTTKLLCNRGRCVGAKWPQSSALLSVRTPQSLHQWPLGRTHQRHPSASVSAYPIQVQGPQALPALQEAPVRVPRPPSSAALPRYLQSVTRVSTYAAVGTHRSDSQLYFSSQNLILKMITTTKFAFKCLCAWIATRDADSYYCSFAADFVRFAQRTALTLSTNRSTGA